MKLSVSINQPDEKYLANGDFADVLFSDIREEFLNTLEEHGFVDCDLPWELLELTAWTDYGAGKYRGIIRCSDGEFREFEAQYSSDWYEYSRECDFWASVGDVARFPFLFRYYEYDKKGRLVNEQAS